MLSGIKSEKMQVICQKLQASRKINHEIYTSKFHAYTTRKGISSQNRVKSTTTAENMHV